MVSGVAQVKDLLVAYNPSFVAMDDLAFPVEVEVKGGADLYFETFSDALNELVKIQNAGVSGGGRHGMWSAFVTSLDELEDSDDEDAREDVADETPADSKIADVGPVADVDPVPDVGSIADKAPADPKIADVGSITDEIVGAWDGSITDEIVGAWDGSITDEIVGAWDGSITDEIVGAWDGACGGAMDESDEDTFEVITGDESILSAVVDT